MLFSVARDSPLLIDKFYQSVALTDMVLGIQNSQTNVCMLAGAFKDLCLCACNEVLSFVVGEFCGL